MTPHVMVDRLRNVRKQIDNAIARLKKYVAVEEWLRSAMREARIPLLCPRDNLSEVDADALSSCRLKEINDRSESCVLRTLYGEHIDLRKPEGRAVFEAIETFVSGNGRLFSLHFKCVRVPRFSLRHMRWLADAAVWCVNRGCLEKKSTAYVPSATLNAQEHWNLVHRGFDDTKQQLLKLVNVDANTPLSQVITGDRAYEEGAVRQSTLLAELQLISIGFAAGGHIDEADLRDRILRISAGVELLQYSDLLKKFQEVLAVLFAEGAGHADVRAVGDLYKDHTKDRLLALKLSEVQSKLAHVRRLLHGLQAFQVELVASILESVAVVNFLRAEPDFATQMRIVTGEMQGSMHMDTLHHLAMAEQFLRRVVPALALKGAPIVGLDALARNVKDMMNDEARARAVCATFREAIAHTQAHLAEIQRWFSAGVSERSAAKTVAEVRSLMTSGAFFACSPKNGGGLEGQRSPEAIGRMRAAEVVERVRETVFAVGEVSLAHEDRTVLRSFLKAHEAAEACRKLVDRAEMAGLPLFQSVRFQVGGMGRIDEIQHTATMVREAIDEWGTQLSETLTATPRLHFLDFAQLLEAIRLIGGRSAATDPDQVVKLTAYVCACFLDVADAPRLPDAPELGAVMRVIHCVGRLARRQIRVSRRVVGRLVIDESDTEGGGDEMVDDEDPREKSSDGENGSDVDDDGSVVDVGNMFSDASDAHAASPHVREEVIADLQQHAALHLFAQLVDRVERRVISLGYSHSLDDLRAAAWDSDDDTVSVWHARSISPAVVFSTIVASLPGVPSVAQVLWCDSDTRDEDVQRFLDRSRALSHLQYFIVGVDLLSSVVREGLVQQLVKNCDDKLPDRRPLGHLCVVVTGPMGAEAFSFLPRATFADTDALGERSNAAKLIEFGAGGAFDRRTVVIGAECDGKTTFCRDTLSAICGDGGWCSLAVHESFGMGPTAEWYDHATASDAASNIGMHVNVLTFRRYLHNELQLEEEGRAGRVFSSVDESVTARLQQLRRFFHGLLCSGLIVDPETGALAVLKTDTRHHLTVELPALLRYAPSVGRHPFLDHLPLEAFGFDTAGPVFPLKIDDAAREVAYFFSLAGSTPSGLETGGEFPPVPASLTAEIARTVLEHEFVKYPELQRSMMAKAQFIAHMAERSHFLRKLKEAIIMYQEVQQSGTLSRLFQLFVSESCKFVDGKSLKDDWSKLDGITCRPMPASGTSELTDYLTYCLLYVRRTLDEARSHAGGRSFRDRVLCTDTSTAPDALSMLRAAVNSALGLNAGGDKGLVTICAAQVRVRGVSFHFAVHVMRRSRSCRAALHFELRICREAAYFARVCSRRVECYIAGRDRHGKDGGALDGYVAVLLRY